MLQFVKLCHAVRVTLGHFLSVIFSVEASSGAMGGSKSQEFDLLSPIGEDLLYTCEQ